MGIKKILLENPNTPEFGKSEKEKKKINKSQCLNSTGINIKLDESINSNNSVNLTLNECKINNCVYIQSIQNSNNLSGYKLKENYSENASKIKNRKISTSEGLYYINDQNEYDFDIELENKPEKNYCCQAEKQCLIF